MKKNTLIVMAMVVVIICLYGITSIASNSSINIENFSAIIDIDENGNASILETWLVNWPSGTSVSFRDIGFSKYHENNPLKQDRNNKASFDTEEINVEVFDKNLRKLNSNEYRVGYSFRGDKDELGYPIECIPYNDECESIFIQVYSGMQSQMTFKYNYQIIGAITKYSDVAELNWQLLQYFESKVKKASVIINLPKTNKDEIYAWGHGLSKGTVDIENNKVLLEIDSISKNEFLEFRILFPRDKVDVNPRNNLSFEAFDSILKYEQNLANETNKRIKIAQIIFYGTFLLISYVLVVTYYIYNKYDKEYKSEFTHQYYRELPKEYSPAEMSYLYHFRKINDEDLTATLLDLIRRKYLILDTASENVSKKDPDFIIKLNKDKKGKLLDHERHLINWFINDIGNGEEVSFKQIENYPKENYSKAKRFQDNAKSFVSLAKRAGSKHDFFEDRNKNSAYGFVVVPILYLFISLIAGASFSIDNMFALLSSIILTLGLSFYIASIKKRSENGNEDYVRWRAFKNFLEDFGTMKDYPIPGIVVWEHYLVYATSLKIADKVMQQLKIRLPNIEEAEGFNQSTYFGFGYRYYGFHFGYTLGRINNTVSTARRNSSQTIQAHNSARVGSGGRGGGFGGGSSFGGGGGGFRGR